MPLLITETVTEFVGAAPVISSATSSVPRMNEKPGRKTQAAAQGSDRDTASSPGTHFTRNRASLIFSQSASGEREIALVPSKCSISEVDLPDSMIARVLQSAPWMASEGTARRYHAVLDAGCISAWPRQLFRE